MKPFSEKAIVRILEKVPKKIAIGAIIRAEQELEIRTITEVQILLDNIVEQFFAPIPDFLLSFLKEVFPNFFKLLSLYIATVVSRYLQLLPGDELTFPPLNFEEAIIEPKTADVEALEERIDILELKLQSLEDRVANAKKETRDLLFQAGKNTKTGWGRGQYSGISYVYNNIIKHI